MKRDLFFLLFNHQLIITKFSHLINFPIMAYIGYEYNIREDYNGNQKCYLRLMDVKGDIINDVCLDCEMNDKIGKIAEPEYLMNCMNSIVTFLIRPGKMNLHNYNIRYEDLAFANIVIHKHDNERLHVAICCTVKNEKFVITAFMQESDSEFFVEKLQEALDD